MLSHRQRFDESYVRSHNGLIGALDAIKAAKAAEDAKVRQGLQDQLTGLQIKQGQQSVAQNQMTLDKQTQDTGLVSKFNDELDRQANPAAAGPAQLGQPSAFDSVSPFTDKGLQAKGDQFKYSIIAKRRTLAGKEATPDQVRQEYEAAAAQNTDTIAAAGVAPKLRELDMGLKSATITSTKANAAHAEAEAAKTRKETEILGKAGGKPLTADQTLNNEGAQLGKYLSQAKDFIAVRDSYSRIQTSAKKPSAAGDLSLIFNYMKMLDPGSTVREGEFANAQNAGGAFDRVGAMYNKVLSGERLVDTQRMDFLDQAKSLYAAQKNIHTKTRKTFEDIATRSGLNPANVAPDLSLEEEQTDDDIIGAYSK